MVQTNPPEGPAVLHVTCELGEHVSGKYWLVEGTTLSKSMPQLSESASSIPPFKVNSETTGMSGSGRTLPKGRGSPVALMAPGSSNAVQALPSAPVWDLWKSPRCAGTPM